MHAAHRSHVGEALLSPPPRAGGLNPTLSPAFGFELLWSSWLLEQSIILQLPALQLQLLPFMEF